MNMAHGTSINLSSSGPATLDTLHFADGDIINTSGPTMIFYENEMFEGAEDINAVHVLANGNILLSTNGDAQFTATHGGLVFKNGDIVEYNISTGIAGLYYEEDGFGTNLNIDAFSLLSNGHFVLSTNSDEILGGTLYKNGDLVEYDPTDGTASRFFSESLFGGANANIDAVHVLPNGDIVLSTEEDCLTLGGLTFKDGDLVLYHPELGTAEMFFAESNFSVEYDVNIDGVHVVPLPASIWLFSSAMLGLVGIARRKKA
jgi:hypothetical protein